MKCYKVNQTKEDLVKDGWKKVGTFGYADIYANGDYRLMHDSKTDKVTAYYNISHKEQVKGVGSWNLLERMFNHCTKLEDRLK